MTSVALEELIAEFQKTWPNEWTNDSRIADSLTFLISQIRQEKPSALPYVLIKNSLIFWAITASTVREIRDYFEDSRAWLQSVDSHNLTGEVLFSSNKDTGIAVLLSKVSIEGYGRWRSPLSRGPAVIFRLAQMHRFLATKPDTTRVVVPTLPSLRLAFITSLSVGDWERAESCIDEIDRWNLDQASNTLHMRIRLLEAQGAVHTLFELVCQQEAWNFSSPSRIAAAILNAVDCIAILPKETAQGANAAFTQFKEHWYSKLYQLVEDAREEQCVARILAMAATLDRNHPQLQRWLPIISTDLANFLTKKINELDATDGTINVSSIDFVSKEVTSTAPLVVDSYLSGYWKSLHDAVRNGNSSLTRSLLERINEALLGDVDFLAGAPDGLLEMLSDPEIDIIRVSQLLRMEVVATLIDAFVGATDFPRLDHLECYLALLEGMVILNSATMNPNESQLLLGLVGASVYLSADAIVRCEQIVRQWWSNRPVTQRLDWLSAALDTLATVHLNPHSLIDLFIDGLGLAARRGHKFTQTQVRSWEAIGLALELSERDIAESLLSLKPSKEMTDVDPLAVVGLQQVAIISLQETSAREAAREIERRSGAKVSVVTSSVADYQARHASKSDLILYVWAATSHATYRSLDGVRERIEYVQGTGSSSIVVAAERWAERHKN